MESFQDSAEQSPEQPTHLKSVLFPLARSLEVPSNVSDTIILKNWGGWLRKTLEESMIIFKHLKERNNIPPS